MRLRRSPVILAMLAAGLIPSAARAAPPPPPPPNCPQPTVRPGAPPERRVCSAVDLNAVLRSDFTGRVVVPRDASWEMKQPCGAFDEFGRCVDVPMRNIPLRSGVQLVGERGALGSRPLLYTDDKSMEYSLFEVKGNDVRVEGLHLRGPEAGAREPDKQPYVHGVTVVEDPAQRLGRRVVIADNELDEWPGSGVQALGTVEFLVPPDGYAGPRMRPADAGLVRVERNYIHNNAQDGGGYGVVVGNSAYVTIEGNVFDFNRHDVSADGFAFKGYVARFNYVLEGGFTYGDNGYYGQHFDVHGIGTEQSRAQGHYDGGPAGEFFQIAFNTVRGEQDYGGFLGIGESARAAFELRGRPSIRAEFSNNVVVHDDSEEAIRLKAGDDKSLDTDRASTFNLRASGNSYDTDYTREIAAGDFDGDGRTDVFVATGTAWFFSRAGIRPWEFLRASNKRTGELGFADIDNDGITDVLYRDSTGKVGYVKSGGTGTLVPLTTSPVPMKDMRFGDFDGDGKTDIFHTLNREWNVWYGRTRAWADVNTSVTRIGELLFGEFDAVRGTDVAAVKDAGWSISSAATKAYAKLNGKLTNSFASAVVGDFNGNGRSDIAFGTGLKWTVSYDGRAPLTTLRNGNAAPPLKGLLVGRFDRGRHGAQVAGFDSAGLYLNGWTGQGTNNTYGRRSTQRMR